MVSNIFSADQLKHHVDWMLALHMTALSLLEQVLKEQDSILMQKKAAKDSQSIFNVMAMFENVKDSLSSAYEAAPLFKVHSVAFKQKLANIKLITEEVVIQNLEFITGQR